jgi:hypothetical protein
MYLFQILKTLFNLFYSSISIKPTTLPGFIKKIINENKNSRSFTLNCKIILNYCKYIILGENQKQSYLNLEVRT